jgi:transposase
MDGHRAAVAPRAARPNGGRPRVPDRNVLAGIVFMLLSSCSWANLPGGQLGCGSPVTCWRRVRDWRQAGVWSGCIRCCWPSCAAPADWTCPRCSLDSVSVRVSGPGGPSGAPLQGREAVC